MLRYTWVAEFLLWVAYFVADGCICLLFACFGFCLGVVFFFLVLLTIPRGGKIILRQARIYKYCPGDIIPPGAKVNNGAHQQLMQL